MLGRVLYQKLQGAWHYAFVEGLFRYVDHDIQPFRESHFEKAHIIVHQFKLIPEADKSAVLVPEHVAVDFGKFGGELASFRGGLFLNEAIQNIE